MMTWQFALECGIALASVFGIVELIHLSALRD